MILARHRDPRRNWNRQFLNKVFVQVCTNQPQANYVVEGE